MLGVLLECISEICDSCISYIWNKQKQPKDITVFSVRTIQSKFQNTRYFARNTEYFQFKVQKTQYFKTSGSKQLVFRSKSMEYDYHIFSKYLIFQTKNLAFQSKYLVFRSKTLDFDRNTRYFESEILKYLVLRKSCEIPDFQWIICMSSSIGFRNTNYLWQINIT